MKEKKWVHGEWIKPDNREVLVARIKGCRNMAFEREFVLKCDTCGFDAIFMVILITDSDRKYDAFCGEHFIENVDKLRGPIQKALRGEVAN